MSKRDFSPRRNAKQCKRMNSGNEKVGNLLPLESKQNLNRLEKFEIVQFFCLENLRKLLYFRLKQNHSKVFKYKKAVTQWKEGLGRRKKMESLTYGKTALSYQRSRILSRILCLGFLKISKNFSFLFGIFINFFVPHCGEKSFLDLLEGVWGHAAPKNFEKTVFGIG